MNLMLISDEQEVLLWAVNGTISDIRTEIGHTDNQAMREDLHKRKTFLPYSCSAGMPSVRTAGSGMSGQTLKAIAIGMRLGRASDGHYPGRIR